MTLYRLAIGLVLTLLPLAGWATHEQNMWPLWVTRHDDTGQATETQILGPLFFVGQNPEGEFSGFRPLYYHKEEKLGQRRETDILYPFYRLRSDPQSEDWSVFSLINSSRSKIEGDPHQGFDVWPFYFSRETGEPDTSYQGLFPLVGTVKDRFGYDELQWGGFPLYWESSKKGVVTRSTPWPFFKVSEGDGHEGLTLWPLFGHEEKPGEYRRNFWLWPIFFNNQEHLSSPSPKRFTAMLPFFASSRSPEKDDTNVLIFFGRTEQRAPVAYEETRYLWPLLVQGRGSEKYVNRWGPVYTHSIRKGMDKTWILWPLWRQAEWEDPPLERERQQLLWFVYWNETQSNPDKPSAPPASKTHLWPLVSVWNNGAGRAQVQFPSPLAVFFPDNEKVKQVYAPLLTLFRYDQKSPGNIRWSLLWNAVTWRETPRSREFHLGPLYSTERNRQGRKIALLNGVVALRRPAGASGWKLSFFDFKPLKSPPIPPDPPR